MFNVFRYIVFRKGNQKYLPRYSGLVYAISELSRVRKYRYTLEPATRTNGIRLLQTILTNSSALSFFTSLPDIDWYTDYFMPEYGQLRQYYDPLITGRTFRNTFYRNPARTREYVIPVEYKHPLSTLPFDQPWNETWHNRSPITLFFHDSTELVLHLRREEITHRYDPPQMALLGLNLPLLFLKYKAYTTSSEYKLNPVSMDMFLRQEVIYAFHDQLIELWFVNLISDLVEARFNDRSYMTVMEKYQRTNIPGSFKQAMMELTKLIDGVYDNTVKLNDFLMTPLIMNKSIYTYLQEQNDYLQISPLRQYFYLSFLRDFPLYKLLIMLMHPTLHIGENERYIKSLTLYMDRVKSTNLNRIPGNPVIYDLLLSKFSYLKSLLD
jgi:hypothetical protein